MRRSEVTRVRLATWSVAPLTLAAVVAQLLAQTRPAGLVGIPDAPATAAGWTLGFVLFVLMGALVIRRVPGNPVGWALWALGTGAVCGELLGEYATRGLLVDAGSASYPAARLASWLALGLGPLAFINVPLILLRFPTGTLLTRRWRVIEWMLLTDLVAILAAWVLTWRVRGPALLVVDDAIQGAATANAITAVAMPMLILLILVAAVSVPLRYRRSVGVERLQLKWFLAAAALTFVSLTVSEALSTPADWLWLGVLDVVAFALLPVAVGVAMVRYRLYDFDRVLSRVMAYTLLTGTLVGLYAVGVLAVGAVLPARSSDLAVAGSTLVTAAAFQPLRRRIQQLVDRRFARSRYDASLVAAGFSARLRDQIQLDQVVAELATAVQESLTPRGASVWLRAPAVDGGVSGPAR